MSQLPGRTSTVELSEDSMMAMEGTAVVEGLGTVAVENTVAEESTEAVEGTAAVKEDEVVVRQHDSVGSTTNIDAVVASESDGAQKKKVAVQTEATVRDLATGEKQRAKAEGRARASSVGPDSKSIRCDVDERGELGVEGDVGSVEELKAATSATAMEIE